MSWIPFLVLVLLSLGFLPGSLSTTTAPEKDADTIRDEIELKVTLERVFQGNRRGVDGFSIELSLEARINSKAPLPIVQISVERFVYSPELIDVEPVGFLVLKDWTRIGTKFGNPLWVSSSQIPNLVIEVIAEDLQSFPNDHLKTSLLIAILVPENKSNSYDFNLNLGSNPDDSQTLNYILKGNVQEVEVGKSADTGFSSEKFLAKLAILHLDASHESPSRAAGLVWLKPFVDWFPLLVLLPAILLGWETVRVILGGTKYRANRIVRLLNKRRFDPKGIAAILVASPILVITSAFSSRDIIPPWVRGFDYLIATWLAPIIVLLLIAIFLSSVSTPKHTNGYS